MRCTAHPSSLLCIWGLGFDSVPVRSLKPLAASHIQQTRFLVDLHMVCAVDPEEPAIICPCNYKNRSLEGFCYAQVEAWDLNLDLYCFFILKAWELVEFKP